MGVVAARIAAAEVPVDWHARSEQELWAELVGCILSSQVRHEACSAAHERLTLNGLLDVKRAEFPTGLSEALRCALDQAFAGTDNSFGFIGKYRFSNSKAEQIAKTASHLYQKGNQLTTILRDSQTAADARRTLISICSGVGPKQASLFLRNIGYSCDLAVLDTHVIRYMQIVGLTRQDCRALNSIRLYERGELRFQFHAAGTGFTTATLDSAVWIVMRALTSGDQQCLS
ncbi:MAG: hypothetical protein KGL75_10850 [Acidobacteriota bacterium]|nr:hypothetical protein [Acidobacteriota bacterium]